jgi:hypothetical protein
MTSGTGDSTGPGRRPEVRWGSVVGAAIGGFFLEWLCITIYVVAAIDGGDSTVGAVVAFVALPAVCALLMVSRRSRAFGAGVLIGLLIGSVTGAGVCIGVGVLSGG